MKALVCFCRALLLRTSSNYSNLNSILLNRNLNCSVSVVQRWIITIWSFVIIHGLTNAAITRTHFYGFEPDTLPALPQSGNESQAYNQKNGPVGKKLRVFILILIHKYLLRCGICHHIIFFNLISVKLTELKSSLCWLSSISCGGYIESD